jgi:hypothetical protein
MPGHMGIHDVGIAYDRYQERDLPIMMTMGRHTQDPVVSFYEYLWNGYVENDRELHERNPEHLSVWGHKSGGAKPLPDTIMPVAEG